MKRTIVVSAMIFATVSVLGAQQTSQSSAYEGVSQPPANDEIVVTTNVQAKPAAGRPVAPVAVQPQTYARPASSVAASDNLSSGNDDGIVHVAQQTPVPSQPVLTDRSYGSDPDGDIVHPQSLGPGVLGEGTTIRTRLLQRLSTATSEKGEAFRSTVASDVMRDGKVLIPAGAEIDGQVVEVSSGHVAGHGTMRLRPDTVTLPDGTRYRLHAAITGTPGSKTNVGSENSIVPDSRIKRDGIEYGGAVGAGATTGAVVGGPVGALTGGLIGAGVVTAHLLISHPQAVLESGTVILFTLTEPLRLVPAGRSGN